MILRAILFDLGGTLLDLDYSKNFNEVLMLGYQALRDYLVDEGLDVELRDIVKVSNRIYDAYTIFSVKSFIELEQSMLYSAILYQLGIDDYSNEDLIDGAIKSFHSPLVDSYHIYKDVKGVLNELKKRKLKLGLVSNNNSTTYFFRLLQKFDLEKYFDSIVVSSELGLRKPHKSMFLHCLKKLNVRSENSIFVGDRLLKDIKGAKNVGIKCIWVKRRNSKDIQIKPDWIVESISEAGKIILQVLTEGSGNS